MGLVDWITLIESVNSSSYVSLIAGNKSDLYKYEES